MRWLAKHAGNHARAGARSKGARLLTDDTLVVHSGAAQRGPRGRPADSPWEDTARALGTFVWREEVDGDAAA